jgi:D-alanyl-D-alanine carboxypeptidase
VSGHVSARLDRLAARFAAKPKVPAMSFAIEQPSTGFTWSYGDTAAPYFIASITKLFTVAVTMQLRDEKVLSLDTRVAELLGADTMRGLTVHDGHDHGPEITVRELLSQTSGIPDHFEQKRLDGTTFLDDIVKNDATWTFDDFLEMARALSSPFVRSTPGRAHYSDLNYQLLGRVIEVCTSGSFEHAVRTRIIEPLRLTDTWLFTPQTIDRYDEAATVLYGRERLHVPKTIASFDSDGAMVSTPPDQLRFLRAFIAGELFPAQYLAEMTAHWNPVFSRFVPLSYGVGIMRFKVPRWQSPVVTIPAMIGHSGSFGTVLYHVPERDLYLAGAVNQMQSRGLAHNLTAQLIARLR